jgi:hypothetical protein
MKRRQVGKFRKRERKKQRDTLFIYSFYLCVGRATGYEMFQFGKKERMKRRQVAKCRKRETKKQRND